MYKMRGMDGAIRLLRTVHSLGYNINDPSIQNTILKKFNITLTTKEENLEFEEKVQKIQQEKIKPFRLFTLTRFINKIYPFLHKNSK